MALLLPTEYEQDYWTGVHPAGYTEYTRWYRMCNDILPISQCTGEFYSDIAKFIDLHTSLSNKSFLEIGCAYGFLVESMRALGLNCNAVDTSVYAKAHATPSIQQYITTANILTHIQSINRNAYKYVVSKDTLCCFSDTELINTLIPQMNRISNSQVHLIRNDYNTTYYNNHPIDWWLAQDFEQGTIFVLNLDFTNFYVK